MPTPRCPLCGARSTWINFPEVAGLDLSNFKVPDECWRCKHDEDRRDWQWIKGPDMVDYFDGRVFEKDPFGRGSSRRTQINKTRSREAMRDRYRYQED